LLFTVRPWLFEEALYQDRDVFALSLVSQVATALGFSWEQTGAGRVRYAKNSVAC
jgi:hypothetical protein